MQKRNYQTIGQMALKNKGHTTGFDYLRIGLATGVVLQHCAVESNPISNAWIHQNTYLWYFILPAFFALSGYLVLGSLFRNSIAQFAALRVLRIVPALAVEVFLSAAVLGAIFTTLPLSEYFTHSEFYRYFLNIIGVIHFTLPGVFSGGFVNAQLWTIPHELVCYIFLIGTALVTLRFAYLRKHFPTAMLLVATFVTAREILKFEVDVGQHHTNGRSLEIAFLWACSIYLFREKLPFGKALMVVSFVLGVLLLDTFETRYLGVIPIAYATICFGLLKLPKIPFGDLSYGVFLFHYPIMQTLHIEFGVNSTLALIILTLLLATAFAMGSWKFVEKPILMRKHAVLIAIAKLQNRANSFLAGAWKT